MQLPSNNNISLIVPVPKESTFKINPGRYAAQIKSARKIARQTARQSASSVRLLFLVNVPGFERFECLAKADFPLNLGNGSDLRNLLNRLLGKSYLANLSGQEFDFRVMTGIECEIEVDHVECEGRENFDFPLVVIRDIQAAGSMNLTMGGNVKDGGPELKDK